ncbi:MAG: transporter substrate-binding domain-containing protein, partial [Pseudomonadales bacterium]
MKKLAIIFVLLFNHTLLLAQPLKVITHDFPPFSYTREGKLQGLSVEMLNAVLTKMKFTDYQIVTLPWKRALKEGQKPGNLLFPFARKPSREPNF